MAEPESMEPHLWSSLAYGLSRVSLPQKAGALFIHAFDNFLDELISRAADIATKCPETLIVINGAVAYEVGGRGVEYVRKALEERGLLRSQIFEISPALHTRAEAEGFADFVKEHNVTHAVILTIPAHLMRAFLTNVHAFACRGLKMPIVPQTISVPWDAEVEITGLRSIPEKTSLLGRLYSECARIALYRSRYEAGDRNYGIASIREGLEHLRALAPEIADRTLEAQG